MLNKIVVLGLVVLCLGGCKYRISQHSVIELQNKCESRGGVSMYIVRNAATKAICSDGVETKYVYNLPTLDK